MSICVDKISIYENLELNVGKLYKVKMTIPGYGCSIYNIENTTQYPRVATPSTLLPDTIFPNSLILYTGLTSKVKTSGYTSYDLVLSIFLVHKNMVEINPGWITTKYLEEIK